MEGYAAGKTAGSADAGLAVLVSELTGLVGELSGAAQEYENVKRAAARAGDEEIGLRAEVWRLVASTMTDPSVDEALLLGLADQLESLAREVDRNQGVITAEIARSQVALNACRWMENLSALERARALIDRRQDPGLWHGTHTAICNALRYGPVPAPQAISQIETEASAREAPGVSGEGFSAPLAAMQGRFDEARAMLASARAYLLDRGLVRAVGGSSLPGGYMEMMAEDYEAAVREFSSGIKILQGIGETGVLSTLAALEAVAFYRLGRLDEMEAAVTLARESGSPNDIATQVEWRCAAAMAAADDRRLEEAERLAREAVERVEPTDFCELRADAFEALAHVEARAGRPDSWNAALQRALAEYDQKAHLVGAARIRRQLNAPQPESVPAS